MKEVIRIPLAYGPDKVNRNNTIYSRECYDKIISQLHEYKIPLVYREFCPNDIISFCTSKLEDLMGCVQDIDMDKNDCICEIHQYHKQQISELLKNNYKIGVNCLAKYEQEQDGVRIVSHEGLRVVNFSLIKP